ncbi:MAG: right-handed parallel beta-helix repeat-containing protein [Trichloromonas sp.]|jgi:parallel beta-helix repeat protein|nr:right-handed parallel beta-helix repeat-containing protein [Trichloromonas sp.]
MSRRLGFFLLLLLLPGWAVAETEYRGEQSLWQDTVWSGDILIDGILTIPAGVSLEIRPGTRVRFTRFDSNGDGIGENEIFIQGVLKAEGAAEAPILFTSAEARPVPGDWGAVNMMAAMEENRFSHCRVEYAYRGFHSHFSDAVVSHCEFVRNVRGMQFQEATVSINDCVVRDNFNGIQFRDSRVLLKNFVIRDNHWGLRCVYSELTAEDGEVTGNLINGINLRDSTLDGSRLRIVGNRKGIYLQGSKGTLLDSELLDNSEHGILLENSDTVVSRNRITGNGRAGILCREAAGVLRDNHLAGNGEYALVNDGKGEIDARGNAWGSLDSAEIAGLIRDGADRPGVGAVDAGDPQP